MPEVICGDDDGRELRAPVRRPHRVGKHAYQGDATTFVIHCVFAVVVVVVVAVVVVVVVVVVLVVAVLTLTRCQKI